MHPSRHEAAAAYPILTCERRASHFMAAGERERLARDCSETAAMAAARLGSRTDIVTRIAASYAVAAPGPLSGTTAATAVQRWWWRQWWWRRRRRRRWHSDCCSRRSISLSHSPSRFLAGMVQSCGETRYEAGAGAQSVGQRHAKRRAAGASIRGPSFLPSVFERPVGTDSDTSDSPPDSCCRWQSERRCASC